MIIASAPTATATPEGPGDVAGTGLEAELGWSLHWVSTAYQRAADLVLADLPGGPRGYQLLVAVEDRHPSSQLALARWLIIDKTAMTYLVDELEGAGLVVRRPDPADRRVRQVAATPAGRAELDRRRRALRVAEEQVLGALPRPDALRLRELLVAVARSVGPPGP